MWSMSANWTKPFPTSLNAVSKNLTLTAVHRTTTNGPSHCRFEEPVKPSRYGSDRVFALYLSQCQCQKLIFVKFLQGVVVTFSFNSWVWAKMNENFSQLGCKTQKKKKKKKEWYLLIQTEMMHASLKLKSHTQITLKTTECYRYNTVLIMSIMQQ